MQYLTPRLFALLAAAALVAGCAPLDESATRTVGTAVAADGVEIRYEAAGRGEPALVFVHGWSCDRSYWDAQMDHFAAWHRVVAVDLGGHGESGLGREDWTMTAFGEDVQAVVEVLDLKQLVLVGHSMGGPVIVEAARLIPGRVGAVIPVDFFNDVDYRFTEEELEGYLEPMRADFRQRVEDWVREAMFVPRSDPELAEWISRDMAEAPPAVAISAFENTLNYDGGAGLAAVRVPVRLINADIYPTNLEALRRHKPDAGLAVMPGVGHFLMMETPDEFNRLLARTVQELLDVEE